jgi:DNA-binding MarR family transcriptional regulator
MREIMPVQMLLDRICANWPEAASPETNIIFGIVRFYELIRESTDHVLEEFDLTPAAFEVLVALRAQPVPRQLTPTELSRSVLLSSGGTTKVLINLENRGLIDRYSNPKDGRSKIVMLTNSGEQLVEHAMSTVTKQDRSLLTVFETENEIGDLQKLIIQAVSKIETGQ